MAKIHEWQPRRDHVTGPRAWDGNRTAMSELCVAFGYPALAQGRQPHENLLPLDKPPKEENDGQPAPQDHRLP